MSSLSKDVTSLHSKEYKTDYKIRGKAPPALHSTEVSPKNVIKVDDVKLTKFNNYRLEKLGTAGFVNADNSPKTSVFNSTTNILEKLKDIPDDILIDFIDNVNSKMTMSNPVSKRGSVTVTLKNPKAQVIRNQLGNKLNKSIHAKVDTCKKLIILISI